MGEKEERFESLEEEVFKALDHQKRRDILRYIGEMKGTNFAEILTACKISDSPTLSYHLRSLAPFIKQEKGKYSLTPLGEDAYNLLLRTSSYNKLALFHKNKHEVMLGNTIMWVIAIFAAAFLKADFILYGVILPSAAAVSLYLIYELFE